MACCWARHHVRMADRSASLACIKPRRQVVPPFFFEIRDEPATRADDGRIWELRLQFRFQRSIPSMHRQLRERRASSICRARRRRAEIEDAGRSGGRRLLLLRAEGHRAAAFQEGWGRDRMPSNYFRVRAGRNGQRNESCQLRGRCSGPGVVLSAMDSPRILREWRVPDRCSCGRSPVSLRAGPSKI